MAAHNWRAIRYRLLDKGIVDPMTLPSIHPILDLTEQAVLESMQSDDPQRDKMEREQLLDLLYRPAAPPRATGRGKRVLPPAPDGFDAAETSASFDKFAAIAR